MHKIITKISHKSAQPLSLILETLEINRSSYYAYSKGLKEKDLPKNALLKSKIKRIFTEHKSRYGARRIKEQLKRENFTCSRNTVAKHMIKMDLQALQPKSFKPKTTLSKHNLGYFPNLLDKNSLHLPTTKINQVWVADITYIKTLVQNFCYLAIIMDLHSRRIIGSDFKTHMKVSLTLNALSRAIQIRVPQPLAQKLIHHSDRGSQYAAEQYKQVLKHKRIIGSMSDKGNCYDNATMESCFGSIKCELGEKIFPNFHTANGKINEFLNYYNTKRIHSSINYLTPVEFELL